MIKSHDKVYSEIPADIKKTIEASGQKMCKADNRYQAYYRYLQSLWRETNHIPVKKDMGQSDNDVYGNYTSDPHANFMTDGIRSLVNHELAPENKGARLIEETRLRTNLLSSQPLCFNLFGELKLNSDKALQFFNILYDYYFKSIDNIEFEYNPARRDSRLTGDRSAFDVFVEYTSIAGNKGFIGIEVKYSETLNEGADSVNDILNKQFCNEPRTRRDRYRELSIGLFAETSYGELEQLPAFQIWRDHLLAVSMCKAFSEKYDEGVFLFLAPYSNKNCRDGVEKYRNLLLNPDDGIDSHFCNAWLEEYIETLDQVFDEEWTKDMKKRYLGNYN
ncbi:MAG: hypothetical protein K2H46_02815 [Muribaculaceae bacterium]|nr:hypothetical protein [Muribaculaceae bacterium]